MGLPLGRAGEDTHLNDHSMFLITDIMAIIDLTAAAMITG